MREPRNAIERGVILAPGPAVGLADLPAQVGATLPPCALVAQGAKDPRERGRLEE